MNDNSFLRNVISGFNAILRELIFWCTVMCIVALMIIGIVFITQMGAQETHDFSKRDEVISLLITNQLELKESHAILPSEYAYLANSGEIYICRLDNLNRNFMESNNETLNYFMSIKSHIVFFFNKTTSISNSRAFAYITEKFDESKYEYVNWGAVHMGIRSSRDLGNGWFDVVVDM